MSISHEYFRRRLLLIKKRIPCSDLPEDTKEKLLCISQFQLRPSPPGQLRGICTHCQSRGSGIILPKGYPRAFDTRGFWLEIQTKTILSEKTSSLSLIGLSVEDWTKWWRFLKVCFLDFRHFLIVYQATTLKRDRERSLWLCISRSKRMRRYPGGGAFALFFHPHPREFATQNKKSANARGLARGLARGGMGAAGIDWCIKIQKI